MTTIETRNPALIPGAIERRLTRDLDDGTVIEFETAPYGWLKDDGTLRLRDHRAYYIVTPSMLCRFCEGTGRVFDKSTRGRKCNICQGSGDESKRTRVPSVSTLLDAICPKPGLAPWSEARGIEGAIQAVRAGEIAADDPLERGVEIVRTLKLGAEGARNKAATRGLDVHELLEEYMQTGSAPRFAGRPVEHHGYIQALSKWLLHAQPQPVAIEHLVCSRTQGYAGRLDLRARDQLGRLITWDAKTQERAGIYLGAHTQVNLYERAAIESGDEPADELMVVVFAADGEYREMHATHKPSLVNAALDWYREAKPINSVCESANRIEREARR